MSEQIPFDISPRERIPDLLKEIRENTGRKDDERMIYYGLMLLCSLTRLLKNIGSPTLLEFAIEKVTNFFDILIAVIQQDGKVLYSLPEDKKGLNGEEYEIYHFFGNQEEESETEKYMPYALKQLRKFCQELKQKK